MEHSYEEIRRVIINLLIGRRRASWGINQFENLRLSVEDIFKEEGSHLSRTDNEIFREVFWDLFRQGIITLGSNDANREFPFFALSSKGRQILEHQDPYFFHDVSSYEKVIRDAIPAIDDVTLIYLKEAMQSYLSGCVLSSSVMLGVAIEHSFYCLLDTIEENEQYQQKFKNVFEERTILRKLNKCSNILQTMKKDLPSDVNEDLDTNFFGIVSMIRNFRNESGHPSGNLISREQCYILLHLFIPCCKKIYQLVDFFDAK